MNIDIFPEFNEKCKKLWTEFEKVAIMTPFQSYHWLSLWHKSIGGPLLSINPKIVHLYVRNQTIAILPFGIKQKLGVKTLNWLGGNQADYMGPLLSPELFKNDYNDKKLFEFIKSKLGGIDLIQLHKQKSTTISILKNMGFPLIETLDTNSFNASLSDSYDEYLARIKKRIISDSNRQKRRINKVGRMEFIIANSKEEKLEVIRTMMDQKSKQYRKTGVWDMLSLNEYQTFFNSLADFDSEIIKTHCSALKVNDSIIATHIGIINNHTFYYLMPAHEGNEWKKYSPGRILLLKLIQWSIENGLKYFDFTIGNESYKKDWCDNQLELYKVIKPITLKGLAFINAQSIKGKINKITSIGNKK